MIQNMKGCIKKISTLLMCFICTSIYAQTLNIQINKIKNNRGSILVSIYNGERGFPYQSTSSIKTFSVKSMQGSIEVTAKDLPTGQYAVALFHDADGNGKLSTNILGMPKEGYAFSNNASSFLGVPGFKDASFYFRRDTTIKIDMKHF